MECDENRVSAKASSRTASKGTRRQGRPSYRKTQFPALRHGYPSRRGRSYQGATRLEGGFPPDIHDLRRTLRAVCLVCAAYAASVLDNAFGRLTYEDREAAFGRCDEILGEFAVWPFGVGDGGVFGNGSGPTTPARRRRESSMRIAQGSEISGREAVLGLVQEVKKESTGEEDLGFELVAGVLEVLSKLDSLL
jgi:hypothetical protein